jgi:hypothetical protein
MIAIQGGKPPEIVEVEPFKWGTSAEMLQSLSILLCEMGKLRLSLVPRQANSLGQTLEIHLVCPTGFNREQEKDGTLKQMG